MNVRRSRSSSRRVAVVIGASVVVATFGLLSSARAQRRAPQTESEARADALFNEARALMAEGKASQACPKLEESERLDPGAGTLLNLGYCYLEIGRTASAWRTFKEAEDSARRHREDAWAQQARTKRAALEPRLSKIVVSFAAAPAPGATVTIDDKELASEAYGTAVPVDPGKHVIRASSPGHKTWSVTPISVDGQTLFVVVPSLEHGEDKVADEAHASTAPRPSEPLVAASTSASPASASGQRTIGLAVGGVGTVLVALGVVAGALALDEKADARRGCDPYPDNCAPDGSASAANDRAYRWAAASTVGIVVGGIGMAVGAFLFFTARTTRGSTSRSPKGAAFVF